MIIGILILLWLVLIVGLWAICKAAGDADEACEWNENWIEQKSDEERKDETD